MDDILSTGQGVTLLQFARQTIAHKLGVGERPNPPDSTLFDVQRATFVTLNIESKLRGCIGNLMPDGSLIEGVRNNALSAAFNDSRFPALSVKEFQSVHLHISILSEPNILVYEDADDLVKKIRPGIDGVILKDGRHGATFLPQVWDQLPGVEAFLGHLCVKAGLQRERWREGALEIKTYQVQAFAEEE